MAAEKATLLVQLVDWFDGYGIPVLTLRGYSGQELVTDVRDDIMVSGGPAVLLYAGDLDPSGEDSATSCTGSGCSTRWSGWRSMSSPAGS